MRERREKNAFKIEKFIEKKSSEAMTEKIYNMCIFRNENNEEEKQKKTMKMYSNEYTKILCACVHVCVWSRCFSSWIVIGANWIRVLRLLWRCRRRRPRSRLRCTVVVWCELSCTRVFFSLFFSQKRIENQILIDLNWIVRDLFADFRGARMNTYTHVFRASWIEYNRKEWIVNSIRYAYNYFNCHTRTHAHTNTHANILF